mmetsp:Transcript_36752/g.111077  ORF Transcript_36752/g.111077 Transcript_36752/m.111077 type:complete len:218 (-) Transcript_36752:286-939(-)
MPRAEFHFAGVAAVADHVPVLVVAATRDREGNGRAVLRGRRAGRGRPAVRRRRRGHPQCRGGLRAGDARARALVRGQRLHRQDPEDPGAADAEGAVGSVEQIFGHDVPRPGEEVGAVGRGRRAGRAAGRADPRRLGGGVQGAWSVGTWQRRGSVGLREQDGADQEGPHLPAPLAGADHGARQVLRPPAIQPGRAGDPPGRGRHLLLRHRQWRGDGAD